MSAYRQVFQVTTDFACATVDVEDDIIVQAAPVYRRFVGQPFWNLLRWHRTIDWEPLPTWMFPTRATRMPRTGPEDPSAPQTTG